MIKAIVLDYGGVVAFPGGLRKLREKYCKLFGIPYGKFTPVFKKNWYLWRIDKINEKQFWENLSGELGFDYDFEQVKRMAREHGRLNNELMSFVKELRGKYKVYILSNHAREWFKDTIKTKNFDELFDGIYTSYDAKSAKPEKEIYLKFLEKFNYKAEECVFVDDIHEIVDAARELGFNAILFKDFEQFKSELYHLGVEVS